MAEDNKNAQKNAGAHTDVGKEYFRLSDRVLDALKLAIAQKDVAISELLTRTLEMAMTRGAGGEGFIERRDFSADVEQALDDFAALKRESKGG